MSSRIWPSASLFHMRIGSGGPCIGEYSDLGGMGPGERGGIDVDADEVLLDDEIGSPEIGLREFRAHAQNGIGRGYQLLGFGAGEAIAHGERMIGGDSAFAG